MAGPRITKVQWITFLIMLGLFSILNLIVASSNEGLITGFLTAFATILGPMTGAISRDFQNCCLQFSLSLMPYFLPLPIAAIATQFGNRSTDRKGVRLVRHIIWALGWLGWFFGGIVSFGHALS